PPESPTAAVLVGGTTLSRSAAAPRTGSLTRCRSQNCPCATAPQGARHARICCWSAPCLRPGRTSTGPSTTCPTPGTVPPLAGRGSPAHAAAAAPFLPGAGPTVGAALLAPGRRLGSGATSQRAARFPQAPSDQRAPPPHPGPPSPGRRVSGAHGTARAAPP